MYLKTNLLLFLLITIGVQIKAQTENLDQKIKQVESKINDFKTQLDQAIDEMEDLKLERVRDVIEQYGIPSSSQKGQIVWHSAMALQYNENHEQADWVSHVITTDISTGKFGRTNVFLVDSAVTTGSTVELDYFIKKIKLDGTFEYDGFGFDRGHLAPSADFRWSATALAESFYYSNMSPQRPDFNRNSWAKLEDLFRSYVDLNQAELIVTTGPILNDNLPKVGRAVNKNLSIPEYYFKAVVDLKNKQAIGFIMPNKLCELPLESYAVSIDSIESVTKLNLFSGIVDSIQTRVEAQTNILTWLSAKESVNVAPLDPVKLPRKHFNTNQAAIYKGQKDVISVCGTVVGTKLSAKGNVFINLDRAFPNQTFTISIFKDNVKNFTYKPDDFLKGKIICVKGKVSDYNGTPSMNIENENSIEIYQP
jgi:endonuclease G